MAVVRSLAVVLLALSIACDQEGAVTVEQVREALVEGLDRSTVERFLGENGAEFSVLEDDELALEPDLSLEPNQLSARYVATIRDVRRRYLLYKESIVIKVDFDSSGKAIHVQVGTSLTGP